MSVADLHRVAPIHRLRAAREMEAYIKLMGVRERPVMVAQNTFDTFLARGYLTRRGDAYYFGEQLVEAMPENPAVETP